MKLKTLIFPLLMIMLFAWGCGDDQEIVNYNEENNIDGRVVGSVHGVVADNETNERLEGILVTWASRGAIHSTTTNSLGYYAITNLSPGDYEITFSGSDMYAVSLICVEVEDLDDVGIDEYPHEQNFHFSYYEDVDLYMLNAAVTGFVYARQDNETTAIAPGVTVIADFDGYDLADEDYLTVTDATGAYLFDGIPATNSVSLRTMPFSDGTYEYGVGAIMPTTLRANDTVLAAPIIATIAPATPFVLINNFDNDDFALTDDLVLTFSKTIDPASVTISLSSVAFGTVQYSSSWANDITLTINPFAPLQANTTYDLVISGMAMDNSPFTVTYAFNTVTGIQFVSTNLERVDGLFDEFAVDADITLVFDMPVDLSVHSGWVVLSDATPQFVATDVTAVAETVTIDPDYDLEPGSNYSLSYRIYSTIEGDYDERVIPFSTAEVVTAPVAVTGFALDMGAGWDADYNTTAVDFTWENDPTADVDYYYIYARDDYMNSDFVRVAFVVASNYLYDQSLTVTLPASFDYFAGAPQTPFLFGTEVSYGITAYNDAGESPVSTLIAVTDGTAPTPNLTKDGGGTCNNPGGSPMTVTLSLTMGGEYMADVAPTVNVVEAGGDPAAALDETTVTFEWDPDMNSGTFTFTVPAATNYAGDEFRVTGLEDTSGNQASEYIFVLP